MKRLAYWMLAAAVLALFPTPAAAYEQTKLTAAEGTANAKFGRAAAISGDTVVVGAPDEGDMGAAYVFARKDGKWTEQATLVPPVGVQGAKFGFTVAISGDTIVVGASNQDQDLPKAGAAYVFVRSGDRWVQQAKLAASDGRADDAFGFDVDLSGNTAVIGAKGSHNLPATNAGAAYVFTRSGSTWTEQVKLVPSDGRANDGFGYSVGISRDTVVVGSTADDIGAMVDQGSAYMFTRRGSTWSQQAKVVAADGSAVDGFGGEVAIFDDTVVVGVVADTIGLNAAQGSAYVFERRREVWVQQAKLTAPDGAAADQFGWAVSGTGDTVVVGSQWDEPDGAPLTDNHGSVYVFNRVGGAWGVPTKLVAADAGGGGLGLSVGISGRTVIAGKGFAQIGENVAQGAAYVFDLGKPTPAASVTESRRSPLKRLG